ncbi:unnamed protein product [Sphagnum balticum]
MSEERDTELASIGQKLAKAKAKEALMTLLPKAATMLEEVQQSPPSSTIFAMKACSDALVDPALLRHKDKDVRLLVALCISEIMRIVAPDAPYSDDCLKEIFQLIVDIFRGLDDVDSPFFSSRVNILETVAKVRSCVVMLDLECDDLITEMFRIFFTTASDKHPEHVFLAMRNVLSLVIEEGEEVSSQILEIILNNLLRQKEQSSPKGRKQGQAVGDGEVLSEDEKEAVDEVNHKGGDHDNNVMAKGASGVETASSGKDPLEDEEEEEKEQEENVPEKRKRGRPKGSAKKKPSSGRTKTTGKMIGPKKVSVAVGMEHGKMEQDKNLPPQLECGQPEGSSNKKDGSDDVLEEAEKDGVEEREEEHHQVKNPEEDGINNNNHEKDDTVKDVEDTPQQSDEKEHEKDLVENLSTKRKPGKGSKRKLPVGDGRAHKIQEENVDPKRKRGLPENSSKKGEVLDEDVNNGRNQQELDVSPPKSKHKLPKNSVDKGIEYVFNGHDKDGDMDTEENLTPKSKPGHAKASGKKESRRVSSGKADRGGDEGLVGCGIKVWWPLDRRFYKGEVVSYNAKKKKHKVLYDDGEQEILDLVQERWELITKKQRPVKVSCSGKKQSSSKSGKKGVSKEGKPNNLEAKFLEAKSPVNTISAFDFDEDDDGEAPRGGKTKRKSTQSSSTPKGSSGKIFKLVSSTKTSAKDDSSDTLGDGEPLNTWVIQRQKAH